MSGTVSVTYEPSPKMVASFIVRWLQRRLSDLLAPSENSPLPHALWSWLRDCSAPSTCHSMGNMVNCSPGPEKSWQPFKNHTHYWCWTISIRKLVNPHMEYPWTGRRSPWADYQATFSTTRSTSPADRRRLGKPHHTDKHLTNTDTSGMHHRQL